MKGFVSLGSASTETIPEEGGVSGEWALLREEIVLLYNPTLYFCPFLGTALFMLPGGGSAFTSVALSSMLIGPLTALYLFPSFYNRNERARWVTALGQSTNDRKNIDKTELAQVEVTRTYTAKQPDELSLQVADVVLLWQTVDDGWYEGQRLRDGECGWFPAECAEVITCQATIQRNVQRMDRLQRLETNV